MLVGLDTNVVSVLARGELSRLRSALECAVDAGRIRIPLTRSLLDEVAATANDPYLHSRICALLLRLCGRLLLGTHAWRVGREALHGGRLPEGRVFGDPEVANAVHRSLSNPDFAKRKAAEFDAKASYVFQQTLEAVHWFDDSLTPLGRRRTKQGLARYFNDPTSTVLGMARQAWTRVCTKMKIEHAGEPSIDRCPSLWFDCSHYVGSVWFVLKSQGKLKETDFGDRLHASEAAYVDRFVTRDKNFLRVMRWAPVPRDRFVNSDQLMAELADSE